MTGSVNRTRERSPPTPLADRSRPGSGFAERTEEATPSPAAATSLQPKGGEAMTKSVPKRIKKKKELSKPSPDDTYAESRAESVAGSETSTREPNKKVSNPALTTVHHTSHYTHPLMANHREPLSHAQSTNHTQPHSTKGSTMVLRE